MAGVQIAKMFLKVTSKHYNLVDIETQLTHFGSGPLEN